MKSLVLALAWALAISGCGGPAPPSAPVTLVFKHARIYGPANPVPRLLREFEAAHPGIRVKQEELPWSSDDQHQYYVINLEGRSAGFDLMMLDCIWVPEFARAGWLIDLTEHLPPAELAAYFPSTVEAATWNRRVWGVPWNMNVGLLYYRADLLKKHGVEPPATWDELIAAVERIKAAERDPKLEGYLWQGKQYEGGAVNALEALWANDTTLLGADERVFPDAQRAAEAFGHLRSLIERGISPRWVTAGDEELTRRAFGDGRAIFLRNWPYVLDLIELPGSAVRGRIGIAPVPGRSRELAGRGSTGGAHLGISAATRHPKEALALARFMSTGHAQRLMLAGTLYPTRSALYQAPDLVAQYKHLPQIHALMLAGRPRPVTPHYLLLSTTLQPSFSAVLVGLQRPDRAIEDTKHRLTHFMGSRR